MASEKNPADDFKKKNQGASPVDEGALTVKNNSSPLT